MNVWDYLAEIDNRLHSPAPLLVSTLIHRDVDANLAIGFIEGRLDFLDGSVLEFSEQLPSQRQKFRFHYMNQQNQLITRWDSAPHHHGLRTYPFHRHTVHG
ncbi:MAG: hypothetical protein JXA93_05600 [Anaerolineae bacterium]|nr:hypothetical protein [Anaerolineae bacterium]